MIREQSEIKRTFRGPKVGDRTTTATRPFTRELFESLEEAKEVLGEAEALKHINYSHNLSRKAIEWQKMRGR